MHISPKAIQYTQKAFSLLEVLAVLVIIGSLVSLLYSGSQLLFKKRFVKQAQAELAQIQGALEKYKFLYGSYPSVGISSLLKTSSTSERTAEPLLDLKSVSVQTNEMQDPWGRPYLYSLVSKNGTEEYLLYSLGPNPDISEDDIVAQ